MSTRVKSGILVLISLYFGVAIGLRHGVVEGTVVGCILACLSFISLQLNDVQDRLP